MKDMVNGHEGREDMWCRRRRWNEGKRLGEGKRTVKALGEGKGGNELWVDGK